MSAGPGYRMPSGGGVESGATSRAVLAMSIGAIKSWQEMRERIWADALDEYDQQFIVPMNVDTTGLIATAEFTVPFGLIFVLEPTRDSPYSTPIFTYGMEYVSGATNLLFNLMVKRWLRDEQGVNGALMTATCFNPLLDGAMKFKGLLHLNYQGYAGPVPDPDDTGE